MRPTITIIILTLFLTNCIDETKNGIEGDWIGYEKTSILGNDTFTDNFHLILSIGKDPIRAINFKFITNGDRDSLSTFSNIISDSNLLITNHTKIVDTFSIEVLNDTAMILSISENKYRYSRLLKSTTETQSIALCEKMFTLSDSI